MSARAILYIVSSLPFPFMALIAHSTNRVFSGVYPAPGIIWSMLGERQPLRDFPRSKGIPVSSHLPVQRSLSHSLVSAKGFLSFLARHLACSDINFQGVFCRVR